MRVVALDHGLARIGVAVSDPTETLARPVGVIEPPTTQGVAEVVRREAGELVVVGLPVSLSGEEGEQARIAREFAVELEAAVDVPIETYDERLTTRLASATAQAGARAKPDALAAAHLLESYLRHRAVAEGRSA